MFKSVSVLIAMLALVEGAQAQDTGRLQRTIDALSSPPRAEELTALGANDANAYVFFVQDFLKGHAGYGGAVNGQLTSATIRAIIGYCRDEGIATTCIRGPLLPESIAAVSGAVAAALAPAVAEHPVVAAETPVDPVEQPVAVAALPVLPDGWRFNDNGGRGTLGLLVKLVSAGPAEAVIHFSGTATRQGYFNIEVGPTLPAAAGTWVTQVSAGRESAADTAGTIWLRTARVGAEGYLGELFNGIRLHTGATSTTLSGTGAPSPDTVKLLPYVQLSVEAGDTVDTTLHLSDPRMSSR